MGPRQVGKTILSKQIMKSYKQPLYLNYDQKKDRHVIEEQLWHPETDLLVFDEIHKMNEWKDHLKGIFDTRKKNLHILVTGSARLNTLFKGGDSLVGRYFSHTLLPFSVLELRKAKSKKGLSDLLSRGGFPEPLLAKSKQESQRWKNQYLHSLLRGDLLDIHTIYNHNKINLLIDILQNNIGSPLSLQNISKKLQLAHGTVAKYLFILEELYLIFRITPFSQNIPRSLLKAPKVYFYNSHFVESSKRACLENLIAIHLLKHCQFVREKTGRPISLHYIRTKDKKEIDFCLSENGTLNLCLKVKTSDTQISKILIDMAQQHKITSKQIVYSLNRNLFFKGVLIESFEDFLRKLEA